MKSWLSPRFVPKLVDSLRTYGPATFASDVVAGLTVVLVALPLGMAFAISSGVSPQAGLYTAIVAGFAVAALGGSNFQIAGPSGAFLVILAGIILQFGLPGLLMCTLMAGFFLILMGVTGLGQAIRYVPRPVITGFTNGIAVLIASAQVRDLLGLSVEAIPPGFAARAVVLWQHLGTWRLAPLGVGAACLALLLLWPRLSMKIPGAAIVLTLATIGCAAFAVPLETVGSRFGGIPSTLPPVAIPAFRPDLIVPLVPHALTVAVLVAMESLLTAVVADGMTGDRHRPNTELIGLGVANMLTPLVGGLPASGALARTVTNIRAGARTPVAGLVHSVALMAILLLAAPLAGYIPLAALAAVLTAAALNMFDIREVAFVLRSPSADRLVWGLTFALTVFADLTVAVGTGLVLAAILYIHRVSETTSVECVTDEYLREGEKHVLQGKVIPPFVTILRIHGPLLFGASQKFADATADLSSFQSIVVLRLRNMTALDSTALHALESFAVRLLESGRRLVVCGTRRQPARLLRRSLLPRLIGPENMVAHVDAALARARHMHAPTTAAPPLVEVAS